MYRSLTQKRAMGNKVRQADKNIAHAGEREIIQMGHRTGALGRYTVLKSNSFLTYFPDSGLCLAQHEAGEYSYDLSVLPDLLSQEIFSI